MSFEAFCLFVWLVSMIIVAAGALVALWSGNPP
jgi:hypothetical protein